MLTDESAGSRGSAVRLPGWRRLRWTRHLPWRRLLAVLLAVVVAFAAATVRLFVLPSRGMPARVDAILMMDGPGDPLPEALLLAREHRARFLLISLGTRASHRPCPQPVPGVQLICFNPSPASTQGEAEFAGRLAARYHWRSIAIVTTIPHVSRGRLRLERCYPGHVYAAGVPVPAWHLPYDVAYEWGAMVKALVLQPDC
ncbi:MAG TPA: hypothetical protein VGI64_22080 [Streptosporangiaceae bacterium]